MGACEDDASRMRSHKSHPFLAHSGPIAFAHRGGAEVAPENTLPAFAASVALGYRYLETDAHVTRDGVVVAYHDPRLDRVTDRVGAIADLDIADVEAADAGYAFSAGDGRSHPFRGRGIRVPRLEDVLLRWPGVRVNIDPKSDRCVAPLVDLLDRLDAWERVCIGSFFARRVRRVRTLGAGRACTSMGPSAVARARLSSLVGWMPRQGADCIQVPLRQGPFSIVTARFIRTARRAGLPVHVWTVNDEATMHALLDLGVDGIMTDRPGLLRDVFAGHGLEI